MDIWEKRARVLETNSHDCKYCKFCIWEDILGCSKGCQCHIDWDKVDYFLHKQNDQNKGNNHEISENND